MKPIRIHIFGDGSAGQRHKRLLHEINPAMLVSISGPESTRSYDFIDACIIASPPDTHREYLEYAESINAHILCEGPVTYLPKNPLARVHMTASNWRFVSSLCAIRARQVMPPKIAHFWFDYDLRKWRPGTDHRQTCYYTSGITNINLHELDMALWFCGPADAYSIEYRTLQNAISLHADGATYMLKHQSGCLTTINSSWIGSRYSRGMRLVYADGRSIEKRWRTPADDAEVNASYREQLVHFLACCETNTRPCVSLADGHAAYILSRGGDDNDDDEN